MASKNDQETNAMEEALAADVWQFDPDLVGVDRTPTSADSLTTNAVPSAVAATSTKGKRSKFGTKKEREAQAKRNKLALNSANSSAFDVPVPPSASSSPVTAVTPMFTTQSCPNLAPKRASKIAIRRARLALQFVDQRVTTTPHAVDLPVHTVAVGDNAADQRGTDTPIVAPTVSSMNLAVTTPHVANPPAHTVDLTVADTNSAIKHQATSTVTSPDGNGNGNDTSAVGSSAPLATGAQAEAILDCISSLLQGQAKIMEDQDEIMLTTHSTLNGLQLQEDRSEMVRLPSTYSPSQPPTARINVDRTLEGWVVSITPGSESVAEHLVDTQIRRLKDAINQRLEDFFK